MRHIPAIAVLLFFATFLGTLSAAEPPSGLNLAAAMQNVLTDVISRTEKSVVAIARVRKDQPGDSLQLEIRPDAFGRRTGPVATPQPTDPDFIPNEYATGVVVDSRGLILTAYHALGQESDYYVTTSDRKVHRATVKGADPRSDLAVLSIEAANLTPITFGNAAELKKGQIVISLGNPYAIARDGQVCAGWGIVSNLARKAPAVPSESDLSGRSTLHHYGTLIQTDAKLNLGASGGPLLNLKGEMVGLTVALPIATGFETAAGYAYPVDATFRRVVETLKQGREVDYGFLGVLPSSLATAETPGLDHGVRVSQVVPGTPAARSGLHVNDIITEVDQKTVHDPDSFYLAVGQLPAESVTRLAVLHNGQTQTMEIPLSKYPVRGKKIVTTQDPAWRGLRVDYLTAVIDNDGRPLGGPSFTDEAVVVTEVAEGSPAWQAGLRRGMHISQIDQTPVRTPKEFAAATEKNAGPVQLKIQGDNNNPTRIVQPGT
jgi:S1-C subfamily serine protease